MNPEIVKYYNESPEVEEWLNAPGGKPLPQARGCADTDALFTASERLLEISKSLEKRGDAGTACNVWIISTELFRMACRNSRHNDKVSGQSGREGASDSQ